VSPALTGLSAVSINPRRELTLNVGDRVRIERDEKLYPSKGTWPQFRGRTGTVVEINRDHKRPRLTEYGVVFTKATARGGRPGKFNYDNGSVTWFKCYEVSSIAKIGETPLSGRTEAVPSIESAA
jgi:hypothetical protein